MNTEIFDYIKALSKKEFFFTNAINCICSGVIIITALISLIYEANILLYAIMFSAATILLGLNSIKCFKRGSKNGWVFAALGIVFLGISCVAVYALFK